MHIFHKTLWIISLKEGNCLMSEIAQTVGTDTYIHLVTGSSARSNNTYGALKCSCHVGNQLRMGHMISMSNANSLHFLHHYHFLTHVLPDKDEFAIETHFTQSWSSLRQACHWPKKISDTFFGDTKPFPAGGLGGAVSPPAGPGAEPRRQNAFWQQSTENWLKIRSLGRRLQKLLVMFNLTGLNYFRHFPSFFP